MDGTMMRDVTSAIKNPTLVLDERIAKENLRYMAEKATGHHVRFRPHFKTHQSAEVGEWMRSAGVKHITVSSVSMAEYFARHGWQDILIAFPVNLRESTEICQLARDLKLSLLVESTYSVESISRKLDHHVDVWIKIDTGLHRAGIWCEKHDEIRRVAEAVKNSDWMELKGVLTHAGQTYHPASFAEILDLFADSNQRMNTAREHLANGGFPGLEVSVGDTPGCWLSDDFGGLDEIRPGNFIFFDAMMHNLGVCRMDQIAVAVACPVVAKHADNNEIVIYGGAVHLSKEKLEQNGKTKFGYVGLDAGNGWQVLNSNNFVRKLSQEHGIAQLEPENFKKVQIGDLLYVIPVHVCLSVHALDGQYVIISER